MDYHIEEGSFTVPDGAQDRSINLLILNHGPGGLTLVVTRDQLQEGENLDTFLTRQLRTMASQVKHFQQQDRCEVHLGAAQLPGLQVSTSFRQNGSSIHQRQTVASLGGVAVLLFTLSCASPLTTQQQAYAEVLLASFRASPASLDQP
ncbi:DcrB-related protein [Janthinobacterium agaricidamnosum]|uniref:DUF1795 domain-containing protein n=1 Tax=Janthinobacterium agaricidamnosum NBRC 102515 = DSM 9628 TaxID=1349767 RepID=W0V3W5_9BURK|nr:DcrB-related protein [Janthinobacterium agaricidamnosum]CDG83519.1 conserved hypothetical protein [Janthinobacterium agaricidamnosum NBRC 102515 = DSM 9628]